MSSELIKNKDFQLLSDLANPYDPSATNIYLFGQACCGKSYLVNRLIKSVEHLDIVKVISLNGMEYNLTEKDCSVLYDAMLLNLNNQNLGTFKDSENFTVEFINSIQRNKWKTVYCIFENAQKLKQISANLLSTLENLKKHILVNHLDINIVNIFCSTLSPEKMFENYLLLELFPLHLGNFSQSEIKKIIIENTAIADDSFLKYYDCFVDHTIKGFFTHCTNVSELSYIVKTNWKKLTPLLDITQDYTIWQIANLCNTITKQSANYLYSRESIQEDKENASSLLQLPHFSRFLLIAAYIASYNSRQSDRSIFVKVTGNTSRRSKIAMKKQEKVQNSVLGPHGFTLDRLFAIFSSIVNDNVDESLWTVSRLVQNLISTKLLISTKCNSDILRSRKYKCVASFDLVESVAKTVEFNLKKHLTDFINA